MNKTASTLAAKAFKKPFFIGSVFLAVLGLIYGLGQAMISQEFAQKEIDAWIANSESLAKKQGLYLNISYGTLDSKGGVLPVAVLKDVRLHVASFEDRQKNQISAKDAVHVATDVLEIAPTSFDLSSFSVEAPASLALRYGTDKFDAINLKADTPLVLAVAHEESPYGSKTSLKHHFLQQYDITTQDALTASPLSYLLGFANNSVFSINIIMEAPQYGETNIFLSGMKLLASDAALLNVGRGALEWKKYPNKHGEDVSYSLASFENITGKSIEALGNTTLAWNVKSASKPVMASETNPFAMGSASVEVKKLRLHAQGSSVDVSGKFSLDGNELLPEGYADIVLTNPAKLRAFLNSQEALTTDDEELINALLVGMTGRGINEEGDIELHITRKKDEAFMLGKLRFEDVLAILVTHAQTTSEKSIEE